MSIARGKIRQLSRSGAQVRDGKIVLEQPGTIGRGRRGAGRADHGDGRALPGPGRHPRALAENARRDPKKACACESAERYGNFPARTPSGRRLRRPLRDRDAGVRVLAARALDAEGTAALLALVRRPERRVAQAVARVARLDRSAAGLRCAIAARRFQRRAPRSSSIAGPHRPAREPWKPLFANSPRACSRRAWRDGARRHPRIQARLGPCRRAASRLPRSADAGGLKPGPYDGAVSLARATGDKSARMRQGAAREAQGWPCYRRQMSSRRRRRRRHLHRLRPRLIRADAVRAIGRRRSHSPRRARTGVRRERVAVADRSAANPSPPAMAPAAMDSHARLSLSNRRHRPPWRCARGQSPCLAISPRGRARSAGAGRWSGEARPPASRSRCGRSTGAHNRSKTGAASRRRQAAGNRR